MRPGRQLGWRCGGVCLSIAVGVVTFSGPRVSLAAHNALRAVPAILPLVPMPSLPAGQRLSYLSMYDRLLILEQRGGEFSERAVMVSQERLAALTREAYRACSDPSTPERTWRAATEELAHYLVAPVENDLTSGEPVSIALDRTLDPAPFAALPLGSGEPFGERFAIRLLAGGVAQHGNALDSPRRMLAVGISIAGDADKLLPLPDAVAEAEDAAGHFAESELLLNRDARAESILRDLPRAAGFHFAGHARQTIGGTALVTGGSEIRAADIAHLDLSSCRLAVLSACFTSSWAGPLLEAGAGGVLATRWNLDSSAARLYAREFYDALSAGADPSAAARAGVCALRRTPGFEHPYYWAAYQFYSRAAPAIPRRQDVRLLAGGGEL